MPVIENRICENGQWQAGYFLTKEQLLDLAAAVRLADGLYTVENIVNKWLNNDNADKHT